MAAVIAKAQFWERAAALALNERQIKLLNRLHDGFGGTLLPLSAATAVLVAQAIYGGRFSYLISDFRQCADAGRVDAS